MDNLEWKPSTAPDFSEVGRLSQDTGLSPLVASLLIQRGMASQAEVDDFLDPNRDKLHDPFLMKDMDKAVSRIMKAIERNERIMVYGDYDVDGTTSVAMVSSFLKGLQVPVLPYIPMRYGEGYGVSPKGVERAKVSGCTLIITLDCGTKDFDALAAAAEAGIDTIVCDHHLPAETLPVTHALLNPKREDCDYPFKELSGAGVAFKLLTGLVNTIGLTMSSVYDHLDLLALSIGADLVDITGENRILAHHGMRKLRKPCAQASAPCCTSPTSTGCPTRCATSASPSGRASTPQAEWGTPSKPWNCSWPPTTTRRTNWPTNWNP